jgi:hypothetical protein
VFGGGVQELPGGGGVADGGGVVDAEHGGEVERVGAAGEGLVELPVDPQPLEGRVQAAECCGEPVLAHRADAHRGLKSLTYSFRLFLLGVCPRALCARIIVNYFRGRHTFRA